MLLYEIDRTDLKKLGCIEKVIERGEYIKRDDAFIKGAFSFGNGTNKDMNRYMHDNSVYCVWIDARTGQRVTRI